MIVPQNRGYHTGPIITIGNQSNTKNGAHYLLRCESQMTVIGEKPLKYWFYNIMMGCW